MSLDPWPTILPLMVPPEILSMSAFADSRMAPVMVPATWSIVTGLVATAASIALVLAEMLPVLTMWPPANVAQAQIKIPVWPPLIVPLFDTLPMNFVAPTTIPAPDAPTDIMPELVMPSMNVATLRTSMPTPPRPAEIVPELLMPPENVVR